MSEPSRRWHVAALSAGVAAVSLVLLLVLIAPTELGVPPQAVSPLPSVSAGPPYFQSGTTSPLGVNVKLVSECVNGSRIDPPYYLVFEGNGQVMAVPFDASTARSVQFRADDEASGAFTVSCATSSIRVPRVNRAR
jgi:hypothetical protein